MSAKNKKLEDRIEELEDALAHRDALIQALTEDLAATVPKLSKLADYQQNHIRQLDHDH